ncbi:TatD family hydrolase [Coraliomargarita sp. SDUM461004]|uniref:TatD family hydrolase n=1 Tax=Thalassobacterium sedimentorum TaxID=3041258 RepID=A0ABU1AKL0_9BACT|nr:TatD family hydrolase [Coraliomargarita sp. SDUM461004]MDQ8194718.1 TatD family hydrolase [Coraliomargarita sp. SDUM461004]
MKLYDAHSHPHAALSHPVVLNGTCPADWPQLLKLAHQEPQIIPAIGLHPWQVNEAPSDWQASFLKHITAARAIGEIGLDQWVDGYDIQRQQYAFIWQLRQAATHNLPVSIHCLKALDPLLGILKAQPCPSRGIHLHAYSGSAEQVAQLAQLGAYFSFHAAQLSNNAKKASAAVRAVPADRLLIETDAPDTLKTSTSPTEFLLNGYQRIAKLREVAVEALAQQVADNFTRYFIDD